MIGLVEPHSIEAALFQFKITLCNSKPAIWRRFMVRGSTKLSCLSDVILRIMPWNNSHLHQFVVGSRYYGIPEKMYGEFGDTLDDRKFVVTDIVSKCGEQFLYEYDFGDGWQHEVVLEKILAAEAEFTHPICLDGANSGPPDDCGGILGYYNLLEALADPQHPEHCQLTQWIGKEWSEGRFDLDGVNRKLKRLKV